MLRLALLGHDQSAHELAQAALDSQTCELTAVCDRDPNHEFTSPQGAPRYEQHWEWLLHDNQIDAVIVGQNGLAQRDDVLRKLVQAGKPLLLTFPPCEAIFAFELEMIRRDGGGPILTYLPERVHPLAQQFLSLQSQWGEVELVTFERAMIDCSQRAVRSAFAADCGFLRGILGRLSQVSATGVSPSSPNEANLAITVENESRGVGRWAVEPASEPHATISVRGTLGKAQLHMPADSSQWKLETPAGEVISLADSGQQFQPASMALHDLQQTIAGTATADSWEQVCRDLEVADMIDHSLRRSRTIELYGDEVSERGTFKGMMAAGGCFLLLLSLFVLFVVSVVEGLQAPFRNHFLWRLWPVYLLAPIVVFLVLQLLQLAIGKPREQQQSDETATSDHAPPENKPTR